MERRWNSARMETREQKMGLIKSDILSDEEAFGRWMITTITFLGVRVPKKRDIGAHMDPAYHLQDGGWQHNKHTQKCEGKGGFLEE